MMGIASRENTMDDAYKQIMQLLGGHHISTIEKIAVLGRASGVLVSSAVGEERNRVRYLDENDV